MTPSDQTASASMLIATSMLVSIFVFYFIPIIISTWILYKKANKPGWAAIVPVYNTMVMAEIGEKPVWLGVVAGLGAFVQYFGSLGKLISFGCALVGLYLLSPYLKHYNWGVGKQLLYIFVPIIFMFMAKNVSYKGAGAPMATAPAAMAPQQPAQAYQPVAPAPQQPTNGENMNQN